MKRLLLFCLFITSGSAFSQVDVTFKVDMRGYNLPFVTANVNGTFNGWCGACNAMTDANSDSIWEATISLPPGTIEYKFTVDGWTGQEMLTPGSSCTVTNSGFTNRVLTFTSATVLPVICWGTCSACVPQGPQKLQISLPITWQDSATVNYTTSDFGGIYSLLEADPANPARLALKVVKTNAAETWAGTTLGTATGFATNIPFSANSNQMQIVVYSPGVGATVRMKAEDKADPTKSVETNSVTTVANAWEILTFNFANQASGTAPINYTYNYNKLSFFPNFGITGAAAGEKTFYLGEVAFGTVTSSKPAISNETLVLFPNPSKGSFEIRSSMFHSAKTVIKVVDLFGRTVLESNGPKAGNNFHVGNLSDGIYHVSISSGNTVSSQKVVIQK